jgi:hypothetical protein
MSSKKRGGNVELRGRQDNKLGTYNRYARVKEENGGKRKGQESEGASKIGSEHGLSPLSN